VIVDLVVAASIHAFTAKTFQRIIEWSVCWARRFSIALLYGETSTGSSAKNFSDSTLPFTENTHDFIRFGFLCFRCSPTVIPKSMVKDHILFFFINTASTCYWVIDKRWLTEDQS
jgi:hypothetical protein